MTTTFIADDDDDSPNDAIGRIIRSITRNSAVNHFSALNNAAWFKSTIPTPAALGMMTQPSAVDAVGKILQQVNTFSLFDHLMPKVDTLSWITDVYPKVDTLAWLDRTRSIMNTSAFTQLASMRLEQQEWWKGVYRGVDWQSITAAAQRSNLSAISQTIAQTGAAMATSLSDDTIESLFAKVHAVTEPAEPEHGDAQTVADPEESAEVDDPILDAVLSRLADFSTWWQDRYPELSSRVITQLNIASRSVVYTFVMYSLPTYLVHFLGTDGIAMSSIVLGMAHFVTEQSKSRMSPANAAAIDSECPYCKAQPGMQCITISGNYIGRPTKMHSRRLDRT